MSRIGRMPITVPAGVTIDISPDNNVVVKGKGGELKAAFSRDITISQNDGEISLTRSSEKKEVKALHGLTRALLNNMIVGVSEGFSKTLEVIGVGYRAQLQGKKLVLGLGFSHPVEIDQPDGITFEVPDANKVIVKGIDKQAVGQVAASIRSIRPPEPYKGKGIRYEGEYVRRKVGKTGM
jgi:large subunit ribosomal protein L6